MSVQTLIVCDKCGGIKVQDLVRPVEPTVKKVTMDEYIEANKSRFAMNYGWGDISPFCSGTSHIEARRLKCLDCGFTKDYEQVVHT